MEPFGYYRCRSIDKNFAVARKIFWNCKINYNKNNVALDV